MSMRMNAWTQYVSLAEQREFEEEILEKERAKREFAEWLARQEEEAEKETTEKEVEMEELAMVGAV